MSIMHRRFATAEQPARDGGRATPLIGSTLSKPVIKRSALTGPHVLTSRVIKRSLPIVAALVAAENRWMNGQRIEASGGMRL